MRRLLIVALLALPLVGCGLPVTAPVGGGQAHLCEYVRDAVRTGSMSYEYAAYFYPRCQPLPAPETDA